MAWKGHRFLFCSRDFFFAPRLLFLISRLLFSHRDFNFALATVFDAPTSIFVALRLLFSPHCNFVFAPRLFLGLATFLSFPISVLLRDFFVVVVVVSCGQRFLVVGWWGEGGTQPRFGYEYSERPVEPLP